jgi:arylsulfatase A-like enzyme
MYSAQHLSLLPGWLQKPLQSDIARNSGYFPHTSLNESILRRVMTYYYATISQIDYHVGRMIEILNNKHIYDNTLIIYTSDHGEYMGFHHLLLKGNYMYDPLVKVPLIIKFPNHNLKSTTTSALVSNLDIAPTLLKTAGCEIPSTMKGMDLTDTASSRNVIITEGWAGNEMMVRTHDYKLLHCADAEQSQLFDLSQDPLELMNCIAKPDMKLILQSLREELLRWSLFDTKTQPYLDDLAPQIEGSHVPKREDNHFISIKSYFEQKMAQQPSLNPENIL